MARADVQEAASPPACRSPFGSGAVPERYPHGKQANQFAYFVKWGMTPAQALQTAFLAAANVLNYGWSDRVGSLEKGKFADVIAVIGDPARRRQRNGAREVRDERRTGGPERADEVITRREFVKLSGVVLATGFGQAPAERTVRTPTLDIGYVESGNPNGFPIVLLHGFPDDVHAYDEVAPPLAQAGHRVLVPYLRGYGSTHFRDPKAPRMAEQAAIAQDVVDFADGLKLQQFAVARLRLGRPRRAGGGGVASRSRSCGVFVAGYSIQNVFAAPRPAAPQVEARSGISGTSTPSADAPGSRRIAARCASCCGSNGRRPGSSLTRRTTRPRRRSTMPISSIA